MPGAVDKKIFMNKLKKFIVLAFALALAFFISNSPALAAGTNDYGLGETVGVGQVGSALNTSDNTTISQRIGALIGVALGFIGLLFFILIIYAGFLWMTAGGNEQKVDKAITLVTEAAVGLIIVAGAYLITRFVGETIINPFK